MRKNFFIKSEAERDFEILEEILDRDKIPFSTWIVNQARTWIEANTPKEPEEAKKPVVMCEFPRLKKLHKVCDWAICPFVDRTYGELAQKREFAAKEKCFYRFVLGEVS